MTAFIILLIIVVMFYQADRIGEYLGRIIAPLADWAEQRQHEQQQVQTEQYRQWQIRQNQIRKDQQFVRDFHAMKRHQEQISIDEYKKQFPEAFQQ